MVGGSRAGRREKKDFEAFSDVPRSNLSGSAP
jgi:hypothetical protein